MRAIFNLWLLLVGILLGPHQAPPNADGHLPADRRVALRT